MDAKAIHQPTIYYTFINIIIVDGQWVKIGSMAVRRRICLVVSKSPNTVYIVAGGVGSKRRMEKSVSLMYFAD